MKRKIIYAAGMIVLLLFVGGHTNLSTATIINKTDEMSDMDMQESTMPVKELYDAYKKDQSAATQQYGGKTITLKGFAVFVGPDVYALPSVELSEKKGGKSRVLCVLPFADYLKLRKVSKGNEVVITGEVRGFYEKGDQVLLKQCVIKE